MRNRPCIIIGLSILSSMAFTGDYPYSETALEKSLREEVACLSAGSCTPDISGYCNQGDLNSQTLEPFFQFSRKDVAASIQLTARLDLYSSVEDLNDFYDSDGLSSQPMNLDYPAEPAKRRRIA